MSVPEFQPGRVLAGKYALFGAMARTPWAGTYRATLGPGQEMVVKVLDTALADQPAALDAILRAGASSATVPQPPALPVLEHGKDPESGALFIVTRLSAYPSLASLIERGPMPVEVVVAIVRSLAQALDAVHGARVAHLAVKPSNVFVGPAPSYPIEIGDFGANAIRALAPDDMRQAFSAPWLAPEQIANDSVAGPSSDVFAVALVAFAALTGKSFWRSCSLPSLDVAAWRAEVIAPPPRASVRAAELGVSLGPAFDPVFSRALSVPRDRFPSAGELARALSDAWEASRTGASNAPGAEGMGPPRPQGMQYAATMPHPEGAPFFGAAAAAAPGGGAMGAGGAGPGAPDPFGAPAGGVAGAGGGPGFGPPQVAPAVDGQVASLSPPMSVAGVPKKGGKGWIFAVVAVVVLLGGGVGFYWFQRARIASAGGTTPASSDTVSSAMGHPAASTSVAAAPSSAPASASAAAADTGSAAAPSASAEAPTAAAPADAAAPAASAEPAAAPPTTPTVTAAGEAKPPSTAAPDNPTAAAPTPKPTADHPAPTAAAPGTAAATGTATSGSSGKKKPCGKFLERCPN